MWFVAAARSRYIVVRSLRRQQPMPDVTFGNRARFEKLSPKAGASRDYVVVGSSPPDGSGCTFSSHRAVGDGDLRAGYHWTWSKRRASNFFQSRSSKRDQQGGSQARRGQTVEGEEMRQGLLPMRRAVKINACSEGPERVVMRYILRHVVQAQEFRRALQQQLNRLR